MKLSAVLAVRDEERMLPGCLRLLDFVDEIIVVIDPRTADQTERVTKRFATQVYRRRLDTFAAQKNFGIDKASGEWILIVDADERVTRALAKEIRATITDTTHDSFRIPIVNFFLGRRMAHGDWQENHVRLIQKERARYVGDIHETFPAAGNPGQLRGELWHFSHRTIADMLRKTIDYGEIQSAEMLAAGHPKVTGKSLFGIILREFWRRMVRHRAYRDGIVGVIEGLYQPFSLFCVHVMLWQRQRRPTIDQSYAALERQARAKR